MSVRRSLIILTAFAVAVPVVANSLRTTQEAAEETARVQAAATMQTFVVQEGTVLVSIPAVGTIEAEETAGLSFLTGGQVEQILVQEGDYVEAGTPLVQLKNRAQVITFEQANLNYETAVRQYQDLLVVDEDEIAIAEANLNSARGAYTGIATAISAEDIAAAELQYQQAVTALNGAIQARGEASPELSDEAIALMDAKIGAATFDAETARLQLEELRSSNDGELGAAGARIAQAERELERAKVGASEYDLAQAQISIDLASARLDQAQLGYDRTILTAPFAGVISNINIEVGQRVSAGAPVLELVDVTPLSIVGEIDEIDVRAVAEGLPAHVEMDALPNVALDAEVLQLASAGTEESGRVSYEIRLRLNSADARIRPGMTAEANIITEQLEDVIAVPNRYVQIDRERNVFFVNILMPDNTLQPRDVSIGTRGDDYTEIVSGVQLGETLAFNPENITADSLFGG